MERGVENREKLREEREKRSCCVTRCGPDMERLWPPSSTPRYMESASRPPPPAPSRPLCPSFDPSQPGAPREELGLQI